MKPILEIRHSDLFRATLADDCGNEGYIGIAPDGTRYHVVVPVDRQIARGLKAWAQPDDGTPFGGYEGWHYFCCLTFPEQGTDDEADRKTRLKKSYENGWLIEKWGRGIGIEISVVDDRSEGASGPLLSSVE